MLRLNAYPVIAVPCPNGLFIPTRSDNEKKIVARIIAAMKRDGMMIVGAPDLLVVSAKRGGFLELKRPAERTMFFNSPQGRLSLEQKQFQGRCAQFNVPYAVVTTWKEAHSALREWEIIS